MNKAHDVAEHAQIAIDELLRQIAARRAELGVTQAELAERAGINRATIARIEAGESNVRLENLASIAHALGLRLQLSRVASGEVHPADIVHRGLAYGRTGASREGRDRDREAALAQAWEDVNTWRMVGVQSTMASLVPDHTQEQATAAATAIQWLGSTVGFDFLCDAMARAGYSIVDKGRAHG
jgi:transcriptional regulator with XRE-family HTH domain